MAPAIVDASVGALVGQVEVEGAGDADFDTYVDEYTDYTKHGVTEVPGAVAVFYFLGARLGKVGFGYAYE